MTVSDQECARLVQEATGQLAAAGMTDEQIRDALLGCALGIAARLGWTPDDIARVAKEYAEAFELAYQQRANLSLSVTGQT